MRPWSQKADISDVTFAFAFLLHISHAEEGREKLYCPNQGADRDDDSCSTPHPFQTDIWHSDVEDNKKIVLSLLHL